MQERIAKVLRELERLPDQCRAAWFAGDTRDHQPFSALENTHLVVVATGPPSGPRAFRFSGTIEVNEIKHQRILYEGETLVRIRNGPRRNLVVRPFNLRYEESAAPAGMAKELAYGPEPWRLSHNRDGDIEFLRQIEATVLLRPAIAVRVLPVPTPYKRVLNVKQVQPVVNGQLVARLRELGELDREGSATEAFYRNADKFCEKRDGGMLFPLGMVNGRGRTTLDLGSVADEAYLLAPDGLDVSTEVFRTDIGRTVGKERKWNSDES